MKKKEYMMPSIMVVKIQTANKLLGASDLGVHDEVSSNGSYARESSGGFDDE